MPPGPAPKGWPLTTRRGKEARLLASVLLLALTCQTHGRVCNYTVWDALVDRASNLATLLQLERGAYHVVDYLCDPKHAVTMFALADASFLERLSEGLAEGMPVYNDQFVALLSANDTLYNSVAMYNLLPSGAWDLDDLSNIAEEPTALALALGDDAYNLRFGLVANKSQLSVRGIFPYDATITETLEACNGYLHITDRLLFPADAVEHVPPADTDWLDFPKMVPCEHDSLYDALLADRVLGQHLRAALEFHPGLRHELGEMKRGSYFLPSKQSVQVLNDMYGAAYWQDHNLTETMLYNVVPRAHCPSDFVTMQSDQTELGNKTNRYVPLSFSLNADGTLEVFAPAPGNASATVRTVRAMCQAEVYLYDGWLTPKGLNELGYVPPDSALDMHVVVDGHEPVLGLGEGSSSYIPAAHCVYPVTQRVLPEPFASYVGRQIELQHVQGPESRGVGDDSDGDGVPVAAVAVSASVGALLLLLIAVLGVLLWRRRSREREWMGRGSGAKGLHKSPSGGAESRSGHDDDAVSSVPTEELVAALDASVNGKSDAWRKCQAGMYKRAAKTAAGAAPLPAARVPSMYALGGSSSTANDSDQPHTPSLTPCTSGLAGVQVAGGGGGMQATTQSLLRDKERWEIPADELEFALGADGAPERLGSGSCGNVFRGTRSGVQDVAIKVLDRATCTSFAEKSGQLTREIALLKELRDKNIVQFYGAVMSEQQVKLVTEYLPGGDLYHLLRDDDRAVGLKWSLRGQLVALDIARGLAYLHARRVVHLDLKSANILLAEDGTAKIADMGLAQVLHGEGALPEEHGTYAWAAPELLMHMRLTEHADLYSFGVVLWEIITHEEPVRGRLRPVDAPEECPVEVRDLLNACLQVMPSERPTAREAFDTLKRAVRLQPAFSAPVNHQWGTTWKTYSR